MKKEEFKSLLRSFVLSLDTSKVLEEQLNDYVSKIAETTEFESDPVRQPDKLIVMTRQDFMNLQPGNKVYKVMPQLHQSRGMRYVGRIPGCLNCFVFADGNHVEYMHVPEDYNGKNWYFGKYDAKAMGTIVLERLNKEIETVKKVYFK